MNSDRPLAFRWSGEVMTPLYRKAADAAYTVGEVYVLVPHMPRSKASHDHYFACIHDAWLNLPEELADEIPSDEHLRGWGLCKAGYCDKTIIKCASNEDAI